MDIVGQQMWVHTLRGQVQRMVSIFAIPMIQIDRTATTSSVCTTIQTVDVIAMANLITFDAILKQASIPCHTAVVSSVRHQPVSDMRGK